MTSLSDVHLDCLEKVLKLLPAKQILLLVLCGSHRINNEVFKLKKLRFHWNGSGIAAWPSLISSFYQLEDLSFMNAPFIEFKPVTSVNFGNLSRFLRNLKLCYFDPSHDLERYLAGTLDPNTSSCTILSGLECLKICSAVKIPTSLIAVLPPTLLELRLLCNPIIGDVSVVNILPRSLTKLDIGTLQLGPLPKIDFPPKLISLELKLTYREIALPEIFSHLPTELVRLKITKTISGSRSRWNPTRPVGQFNHYNNWWSSLPKTLKSLDLITEFKNRIPKLIAFASMPLCVVDLYLRNIIVSEEQLISVPNFCSELRLRKFPSDRSELHRIMASAAASEITVDAPLSLHAPSSLTSFSVDNGELNTVDATFLPQSLTKLSVASISSDAYTIISKLKNLYHLGVLMGIVESSQISVLSSLSDLTVGYNSLISLDAVESLKTIHHLKFVSKEPQIFSSLFDSPEGFLRLPNNVKSLTLDCNVPLWNPSLENTCLVVLKTGRKTPLPLAQLIGCLPNTLEHLSTAYFGTRMRPRQFSKLPKSLKFLELTNNTGPIMSTEIRKIEPSIFRYLPPLYHLSLTQVWSPVGGWEAIRPLLPKSLILFEIDLVTPDWFSPTLADHQ